MDELITQLNSLQTYPNLQDLHALLTTLKQCSDADVQTLLAGLKNQLLVTDLKRLLSGALPSTMTAPVPVVPTAPGDAAHPGFDETTDPGIAAGTEPQIKPKQ